MAVSAAYFIITAWKPAVLRPWLAGVMTIVILVLGLAPEETAREIIRKPWVAGQYVYGNQIIGRDVPALGIKSELPRMAEKGILAQHPFVPESLRRVTPENEVAAGRVLALTPTIWAQACIAATRSTCPRFRSPKRSVKPWPPTSKLLSRKEMPNE